MDRDQVTRPRRVSEPVQVYLAPAEHSPLERLTSQLSLSRSDVIRRALEALERQPTHPLVVRSHPDHAALRAWLRQRVLAGLGVVTTNRVIAASDAWQMRNAGIAPALAFGRRVRQPPNGMVECTHPVEKMAIDEWLVRFADQHVSMTDAVSFAVMRARRMGEALMLDRHFAVAGFAIAGN